MIIKAAADVIYSLLAIFFFFELPGLPDSVVTVFNQALGYLDAGLDMIHLLIGDTAFGLIGVCLGLILSANVIYFSISLIFFVLKKLPFLGIRE